MKVAKPEGYGILLRTGVYLETKILPAGGSGTNVEWERIIKK